MEDVILTLERWDIDMLNILLLDFATELDMHYDGDDLPTISRSLVFIEWGVTVLERAGISPHPDITEIVERFFSHRK